MQRDTQMIDLWRQTLPLHDCLFFRGAIPADKLSNACRSYGIHDPSAVLVLYDDTLFGGGGDGFVLTASHFAFKGLDEPPKYFPLDQLRPVDVQHVERSVMVRGERVEMTGDVDALALGLVRALRNTLALLAGPYRAAAPRQVRTPLPPPEQMLAVLRHRLPDNDDLYFYGDIPRRKLNNVLKLYGIPRPEDVLAVYDDTLFGSAKDGFVVTTTHFCFKGITEGAVTVELSLLQPHDVTVEGDKVHVKGKGVEITGDTTGLAQKLADALQAVLSAGAAAS